LACSSASFAALLAFAGDAETAFASGTGGLGGALRATGIGFGDEAVGLDGCVTCFVSASAGDVIGGNFGAAVGIGFALGGIGGNFGAAGFALGGIGGNFGAAVGIGFVREPAGMGGGFSAGTAGFSEIGCTGSATNNGFRGA